jgi:hypothetical protein
MTKAEFIELLNNSDQPEDVAEQAEDEANKDDEKLIATVDRKLMVEKNVQRVYQPTNSGFY